MTVLPVQALSEIPNGLRDPLIEEYQRIVQNYLECKWLPSELSGGRFCEIVYTILDGFSSDTYATSPSKPANFRDACQDFEKNTSVPRSFQILIPRILSALYEIRNNRGVAHVDGEVDPNHMDATAVLSMSNWIMAELVRVFHQLPTSEAQAVVDQLVERRIPIVGQIGDMKRVLDHKLPVDDQILLLISSCPAGCSTDELFAWTGYDRREYVDRLLRHFHDRRFIELAADGSSVQMLPPGRKYVEEKLVCNVQ